MNDVKSIFISYRRADSSGHAGRLFDYLSRNLTEVNIFMDVVGIAPGDDWQQTIKDSIARCAIMLVVIGRQWLTIADEHGRRRLDKDNDPVRMEVEFGLMNSNVRVIPLLVDGSKLPVLGGLPENLQDLLKSNVFQIDDLTFTDDSERLLNRLRILLQDKPESYSFTPITPALNLKKLKLSASWKQINLGDIAELSLGTQLARPPELGEYPFYNSTGISEYIDIYKLDGEYILLPLVGARLLDSSQRFVFKASGKFSIAPNMIAIKPLPNVVVLDYLWLILSFVDYRLLVKGSGIPKVSTQSLKGLPIPLPPLEQQRNVYEALEEIKGAVQQIRDKLSEQLNLANELEISLFKQILQDERN